MPPDTSPVGRGVSLRGCGRSLSVDVRQSPLELGRHQGVVDQGGADHGAQTWSSGARDGTPLLDLTVHLAILITRQ